MANEKKRCMVCAKPADFLKGGICQNCQEKIRREALGEQADIKERADRELNSQGVKPSNK